MTALNVPAETVVKLHEAKATRDLAMAVFDFVNAAVTNNGLVLLVRPLEFELPSYCSRPEFQSLCDQYISGTHTDDLWLKRSPVRPDVPVVRHSDYTPQEMLRGSGFYQQVLSQTGCDYGVSLVAWRYDTWLASLTIFRSSAQGDFTDAELPLLRECHIHFQSSVIRVAAQHEERLSNNSLATFIWNLPSAAIVLDWDAKLLHFNAAAQELSEVWRLGSEYVKTKKSRKLMVPGDILTTIQDQKLKLAEMKPNRPGGPKKIPILQAHHPKVPGLSANIYFLPSKSLAVTKGNFLITLERQSEKPDERETYDRFAHLSRRERDVVLSAAKGQNSSEIAQHLGTSGITVRKQLHSAYKKLGINSRYELIRMFSENPGS